MQKTIRVALVLLASSVLSGGAAHAIIDAFEEGAFTLTRDAGETGDVSSTLLCPATCVSGNRFVALRGSDGPTTLELKLRGPTPFAIRDAMTWSSDVDFGVTLEYDLRPSFSSTDLTFGGLRERFVFLFWEPSAALDITVTISDVLSGSSVNLSPVHVPAGSLKASLDFFEMVGTADLTQIDLLSVEMDVAAGTGGLSFFLSPEPSTGLLTGIGLVGLALRRRTGRVHHPGPQPCARGGNLAPGPTGKTEP